MHNPESGSRESEEKNPDQEKTLNTSVGIFRAGDTVSVVRSDGQLENDWKLKSFGNSMAVVEKIDLETKKPIKKAVPFKVFDDWQQKSIIAKHESRKGDAENINPQKFAESFGIDTTKPGWEKKYNDLIRKKAGK